MSTAIANQVLQEMAGHINSQGGPRSSWYVGIASDVVRRLHIEHNVPRTNHWFIRRNAGTEADARAIERSLLDWGCTGGGGGGGPATTHVYAYLITSITRE